MFAPSSGRTYLRIAAATPSSLLLGTTTSAAARAAGCAFAGAAPIPTIRSMLRSFSASPTASASSGATPSEESSLSTPLPLSTPGGSTSHHRSPWCSIVAPSPSSRARSSQTVASMLAHPSSPGSVQITNLSTPLASSPSRLGSSTASGSPARSISEVMADGEPSGESSTYRMAWGAPGSQRVAARTQSRAALSPPAQPPSVYSRTAATISSGSCDSQIGEPLPSTTSAPLPKTHAPMPGTCSLSASNHGPGMRPVARLTCTPLSTHSVRARRLPSERSRPANEKRVPSTSVTTMDLRGEIAASETVNRERDIADGDQACSRGSRGGYPLAALGSEDW
mmetsp:Transcript_41677/g.137294  ORF Transcript_41677/g.137294 Transcript_41677/m.137294 type:complete len:338 (-) Transcript_41677:22-1035(-)